MGRLAKHISDYGRAIAFCNLARVPGQRGRAQDCRLVHWDGTVTFFLTPDKNALALTYGNTNRWFSRSTNRQNSLLRKRWRKTLCSDLEQETQLYERPQNVTEYFYRQSSNAHSLVYTSQRRSSEMKKVRCYQTMPDGEKVWFTYDADNVRFMLAGGYVTEPFVYITPDIDRNAGWYPLKALRHEPG